MIPLKQQDQELFWLKRRIKYIEALHGLIHQSPDPGSLAKLNGQFSKVLSPKDLIARIEEIYEGNLS